MKETYAGAPGRSGHLDRLDRLDRLARLGPPARLVARVGVGAVWIVAGALKVPDPAASVRAVRAYDLLPESAVTLVGHGLPLLEILVGLLLVAGLLTRPAAVISALLLVAVIVGIASAWVRGLEIECGCFGGGGAQEGASAKYPWEIARDAGLLALSAWLVWRPRTPWSLDGTLFPVTSPDRTTPEPELERIPDVEGR